MAALTFRPRSCELPFWSDRLILHRHGSGAELLLDHDTLPQDIHNLTRFLDAQEPVYAEVLAELRAGEKRSHWIWFIFPQLRGLGRSEMAQFYGISSRTEAEAYLAHPVLGPRLRECTALVNAIEGRSIGQIFGYPDDLKVRSSMTLFAAVAPGEAVFEDALRKYFAGEGDTVTIDQLQKAEDCAAGR